MEDKVKSIKRGKYIKYILVLLVSLILLLLLVFPPVFSSLFLRPAFEKAFDRLSSSKYQLEFEQINWSLLNRSIELKQLKMIPDSSFSDSSSYWNIELEDFKLNRFGYRKLINGDLDLKSVFVSNVFVEKVLNAQNEIDSVSRKSDLSFLSTVVLDQIQIKNMSFLVRQQNDSLLFISGTHLDLNGLKADSLNWVNGFRLPIIKKLSAGIKTIMVNHNGQKIELSDIKISDYEKFVLLLDQLQISDSLGRKTLELKQCSMELDALLQMLQQQNRSYHAGHANIEMEEVFIHNYQQQSRSKEDFIDRIDRLIGKLAVEFLIDSLSVSTNRLLQISPSLHSKVSQFALQVSDLQHKEEDMTISDFSASTGNQNWIFVNNSDSLSIGNMYWENQSVFLKEIKWNDSEAQIDLKSLELEEMGIPDFLNQNQITIKKVVLSEPIVSLSNFKNRKTKVNSELDFDVKIGEFKILKGDLFVKEEQLSLERFDLLVNDIMIDKGNELVWDSAFSAFILELDRGKWNRVLDSYMIDLSGFTFNTNNALLNINQLEVYEKSKAQSLSLKVNQLSSLGLNWHELIRQQSNIQLDSLQIGMLGIEGKMPNLNENKNQRSLEAIDIAYLNIPQFHLDMSLSSDESMMYFEQIAVKSEDLHFSNKEKDPLSFTSLELNSDFSSFSNRSDSLLVSVDNWSFNNYNNYWDFGQLDFQYLHNNDTLQLNSKLQLEVPDIVLEGLNPFEYYVDKKFKMSKVKIDEPYFSFNGSRALKIKNTLPSKNWQQELRDLLQTIVAVDLGEIELKNADFHISDSYLSRKDEINISNLNLNVEDFYIDYTIIGNWDQFMFSKSFNLNLETYSQHINNGQYLLDFKKLHLNSFDRKLNLEDFSILSLSDSNNFPANIKVANVMLQDFYLYPSYHLPALKIGQMHLERPFVQLKKNLYKSTSSSPKGLEEIHLYKKIKPFLTALSIRHFSAHELGLKINGKKQDYFFDDIDVNVEALEIDSNNIAFTDKKFLYSDDLEINIPHFVFDSKDRFYQYKIQNLNFSSSQKQLIFDSLEIKSVYDRKTFVAHLEYQRDQLEAVFPKISLQNIDLRDAIFRNRYRVNKIVLEEPHLLIYKDKTVKADTAAFKAMPAKMLEELPFHMNLDTLFVNNGFLQYDEFAELSDRPGSIHFNQVGASIFGISNDKDWIGYGGVLKVNAHAKLMSEANVFLNVEFPLNSNDQEFVVAASMESMKAKSLNPLIQPLTLLMAKDGELMQMQLNVSGNNEEAYGEMILKYEDLKVEVLNRKLKESQLASFLANSLLIRKNNKNIFLPRKGPVYFQRIPYRSFFHYLSHFAIIGAKTSLGIDKRKTLRKIKDVEAKKH